MKKLIHRARQTLAGGIHHDGPLIRPRYLTEHTGLGLAVYCETLFILVVHFPDCTRNILDLPFKGEVMVIKEGH